MKKYLHTIIINSTPPKSGKIFTYQFGNTKNIEIKISNNRIAINVWLSRIYDKNEMISSNVYLFPDALKKALLAHILMYSENISIKKIVLRIDSNEDSIEISNGHYPPIYSLIMGKLERKLSGSFSAEKVISRILIQSKYSYDARMAALFAFIYSKSKCYEAERFIYLWMAFNGMYGYLSKRIAKINNYKNRIYEGTQIKIMQNLLCVGNAIIDNNDKTRIARIVSSFIRTDVTEPVNRQSLEKGFYKNLAQKISNSLIQSGNRMPYNLTAYGYLLTQFSYYFRCNIIHADKPLALLSYADDNELKCLRVINDLLEECIDQYLPLWFSDEYIEQYIDPFIETITIK